MTRHTLRFAAPLALLLACTLVAPALAADASGTWNWTFKTQDGQEFELSLDLKQDGEKLTGTLNLPNGMAIDIQEGTIKADQVSFQTVFERNDNKFVTQYKGKLEDDTITGTTERERGGEKISREWVAKRKK